MGLLLLLIGGGWALLGMANIVMGASRGLAEGWIATSLPLNGVLFVVPGLVLVGW